MVEMKSQNYDTQSNNYKVHYKSVHYDKIK